MSPVNHSHFRHSHDFVRDFSRGERRTRLVIAITGVMMVVEITAGLLSHSMALLADGWHMSTHVSAFLITAIAYYFTRRHASNVQFSFGTGKIGVLGGFASAVVLSVVAFLMAGESVHRLFVPLSIHFNEAIAIACIALTVNLVCAFLLKEDHHHGHDHHGEDRPASRPEGSRLAQSAGSPSSFDSGSTYDRSLPVEGAAGQRRVRRPRHSHDHDLNLRAAYLHVLADAFTTLLAIVALTSGKFLGWSWLDPVVGLVGSGVVFSWAYGLLRATSGILLDRTPVSSDLPEEIRRAVEADGDSIVTDLHVWQVGVGKFAAIVSIVAHEPKTSDAYRELLREHEELVHLTIETQHCREDHESLTSS